MQSKSSEVARRALVRVLKENTREVVEALSSRYGFNKEEAMLYMEGREDKGMEERGMRGVPAVEKAKVPLPFCGVAVEGWCEGVKVNHGLYTQCMNARGESGYCAGCEKKNHGNIKERVAQGDLWRDKKGKEPIAYEKVMKKFEVTREQAIEEASKFGLTIPESAFEVATTRKGRPKKAQPPTEKSTDETPKKRGRPKKVKPVEAANTGDDLIATLVSQAMQESEVSRSTASDSVDEADEEAEEKAKKEAEEKAKKEAEEKAKKEAKKEAEEKAKKEAKKKAKKEAEEKAKKEAEEKAKKEAEEKAKKEAEEKAKKEAELEEEDEDEEEDEEEVEVEKFKHEGKTYLKDSNNVVYDLETQEPIGTWNAKEKEIMPLLADDEE